MLTVQYAKALPAFRVNAVDPGYTATDLNDHGGHQTVEQGAEAIVKRRPSMPPDRPAPTSTTRASCRGSGVG